MSLVATAVIFALAAAAPPPSGPAPDGVRCLKAAFPDAVCDVDARGARICGGERLSWRAERPSGAGGPALDAPDLATMFAQPYHAHDSAPPPPPGFDPGRARHAPLFHALYGGDAQTVRRSLADVRWLPDDGGGTLRFNRRAGAAAALQRVADDIARELPTDLRRLAAQTSGTFKWRTIRGTDRLSAHSWGIAIDVAVPRSDYWRWSRPRPDGSYRYRNRFPLEIVAIFERHGFIWGGRWHHFDTMHFEYRPELLVAPCVRRDPPPTHTPEPAP